MPGESDRNTDPIAEKHPQLEEKKTSQEQIAPGRGWTFRDIRRDIAWVLGVVVAILFGAVRPEVNHPNDFWVAAIGAILLLATIGLYLYDVVGNWRKPLYAFLSLSAVIAVIVADKWNSEYELSHPIAAAPSPSPPPVEAEAQFEPPRFAPEITSDVIIEIGTSGSTIPRSRILPCPPYRPDEPYTHPPSFPIPAIINGLMPVSLCAENDRILADVKLWDDPTRPRAEVIHNHFAIQPTGWDWNFDDEAFEAVDEQQRPMLQLVYRSPSEIDVRGLFITGGLAWLFTDKESVMGLPFPMLESEMAAHPITRIFKYPREKFPHVRE